MRLNDCADTTNNNNFIDTMIFIIGFGFSSMIMHPIFLLLLSLFSFGSYHIETSPRMKNWKLRSHEWKDL